MTYTTAEKKSEELRPRLIVWELTSEDERSVNDSLPLDQHECLLVLDGIARTSKPIIVVKGPSVIYRDNIREIIDYGHTLDLKMIVELQPEELTQDLINHYRSYGVRVFRIILDDRITEDADTRFRQSPQFLVLETAVELLKDNGFELHFSLTLEKSNRRSLAFNLDYAFLKGAKGLYCHLRFPKPAPNQIRTSQYPECIDEFLINIPDMKGRVPNNMYLSPQCVRYIIQTHDEGEIVESYEEKSLRWIPTCLAGRTFGFLDAYGKLYFCQGADVVVGDLRSNGYDFKSLWFRSDLLSELRSKCRSCSETRLFIEETKSHKKAKQLVVKDNVRNLP
jgi:hypothetical protein